MSESESRRVQVDWSVPTEEWERTRRHVESKYGSIEGHLSREVENAMAEYAHTDGYHEVEELVNRLVQAAGRTLGDRSEEKNSPNTNSFGAETTRARPWVDKSVLASFKDRADDDTGSYGRVLAKALRAYREGGRADRLKDKLERVVDDAERMLKTVRDDESGSSMTKKERQTVAICSDLPPESFSEETLHEKIKEHAGGSDYYLETYTELVVDRLGPLKTVENVDGDVQYLTPGRWKQSVLVDVIDDLGGDPVADSCPAFTHEEAVSAINQYGDPEDSDDVETLLEALLDRLGFVWDDEHEVYDSQRRSSSPNTDTDEPANDYETSAIDGDFAALEAGRRVATDGGEVIDNE